MASLFTLSRHLARDVLADSGTRASFALAPATTGYDGGAYVRSADGCWSLKVNLLEQIRFVASFATLAGGR